MRVDIEPGLGDEGDLLEVALKVACEGFDEDLRRSVGLLAGALVSIYGETMRTFVWSCGLSRQSGVHRRPRDLRDVS